MRSKIWAHRGSSKAEPENTMAAFRQAILDEADGIELDVQFTRDAQVAVIHDENLRRLAGQNLLVKDLNYADLAKLNIAAGQNPEAGFHRAPLLSEVLDLLQTTDLELNIELKNSVYLQPGLEEAVIRLVNQFKMNEQVWYSSFNHYSIRHLANLGVGDRCGILFSEMIYQPWEYVRQTGAAAIHPMLTNLQLPDYAREAQENGILIHAWTIDQPEHLELAFGMEIDAVITNLPARALDIRERLVQGL